MAHVPEGLDVENAVSHSLVVILVPPPYPQADFGGYVPGAGGYGWGGRGGSSPVPIRAESPRGAAPGQGTGYSWDGRPPRDKHRSSKKSKKVCSVREVLSGACLRPRLSLSFHVIVRETQWSTSSSPAASRSRCCV